MVTTQQLNIPTHVLSTCTVHMNSQAHTHEYPTEACDIPQEFIGLFTQHCKHDAIFYLLQQVQRISGENTKLYCYTTKFNFLQEALHTAHIFKKESWSDSYPLASLGCIQHIYTHNIFTCALLRLFNTLAIAYMYIHSSSVISVLIVLSITSLLWLSYRSVKATDYSVHAAGWWHVHLQCILPYVDIPMK